MSEDDNLLLELDLAIRDQFQEMLSRWRDTQGIPLKDLAHVCAPTHRLTEAVARLRQRLQGSKKERAEGDGQET